MMRFNRFTFPTFGKFKSLLTEKYSDQILSLNQHFYEYFFKSCLTENGFISFIRYKNETTLYLKLYYFENTVRDDIREVENFINSFYFHEHSNLKYQSSNIIRVPIKCKTNLEFFRNKTDVKDVESVLLQLITDNSWIGVDFSGTQGGLTIGMNNNVADHLLRMNKYRTKTHYVSDNRNDFHQNAKLTSESAITIGKEQPSEMRINLTNNQIVIGWDKSSNESEIIKDIRFIWMDIIFNLTVNEFYGVRSNTIKARLSYLGNEYEFGVGRCSLGAGSFGCKPNIIIKNKTLKFIFGKHCISIKSELISKSEAIPDKNQLMSFSIL